VVWFTLGYWAGTATPGITLDIQVGLSDDHLDFRAEVDRGPGRTAGARGVRGRPHPRRCRGPWLLYCDSCLLGEIGEICRQRTLRDTEFDVTSA
jgi:hypothetical protein